MVDLRAFENPRGACARERNPAAAFIVALLVLGCADRPDVPMVVIPAATLSMGCDRHRDPSCSESERPAHPVRVASFRIDLHEITQSDYGACVDAGACARPPREAFDPVRLGRRPVTQIDWSAARAFCAWMGRRLPTEAEWELAARGTDGRVYPWGDEPPTCARAHTSACGDAPADVGARAEGASPYGVLDMAGNVDEWTADPYAPYGSWARSAEQRVARGGAYDAWHSRSTARNALAPSQRDAFLGARCASSDRPSP